MNDYITKEQLKEAVRECLLEILSAPSSGEEKPPYPASKAYKLLGYSSPNQLYDAIYSGLLRIGHEVEDRRSPKNVNSRYYFHIEKCLQRFKQLPERRK